jgi:hypothetical protein
MNKFKPDKKLIEEKVKHSRIKVNEATKQAENFIKELEELEKKYDANLQFWCTRAGMVLSINNLNFDINTDYQTNKKEVKLWT